jgi:hypothetical protein
MSQGGAGRGALRGPVGRGRGPALPWVRGRVFAVCGVRLEEGSVEMAWLTIGLSPVVAS